MVHNKSLSNVMSFRSKIQQEYENVNMASLGGFGK